MREADIALAPLPQADGARKNRPVLILRELPPFGDFLVCGVSGQIHQAVAGFDEVVRACDGDFPASGLLCDSVIRLGFLAVLPRRKIVGTLGAIDSARHERLLKNLANHLTAKILQAARP
ncbi:MAG: transcriptional regulator [Candidatus Sumerlaeota bacterium]|nr:transcriptional regulator [Candidatus Sumerlaeota bacterium]